MLSSISILSRDEYKQIADTLDALYDKWQKGTFVVTSEDEDGHTAIEKYLTAKLGPIGKKVHTGRSRNDQALVMMRLYLRISSRRSALKLPRYAMPTIKRSQRLDRKRCPAIRTPKSHAYDCGIVARFVP